MTTPNALEIIRTASCTLSDDVLLGAGTVLDVETAKAALDAGAQFFVSPTINRHVIELAHRYSKMVIPGAYTPNEILSVWEMGADLVKLFPADIGGIQYMKAIRSPLPQIKIMPVGGVSLGNLAEFIRAGAKVVGIGSNLVNQEVVDARQFDQITEMAHKLSEAFKRAHIQGD